MTDKQSRDYSDTAVILVGHGAPATDCPPQLVGQLMGLEWGGGSHHGSSAGHHADQPMESLHEQIAQLEARIRNWPRHAGNDPYKAGLERVAEVLRPLIPVRQLIIAYNEFCRPSIAQAIEEAAQQGARRIFVIPTMLTPGGVHSERDIPQALEEIRGRNPALEIVYLWPFDLQAVAALMASQVQRALS